MTLDEFQIGLDFWCGNKRWRCTDVGTRVIVAISLEPHEVVSSEVDPTDKTKRIERRSITDDPIWLNGPPYGIAEHVFDEDSIIACGLKEETNGSVWTLGELEALARDSSVDVETYFKTLHHFSKRPPFKTRPTRFTSFVEYCKSQPNGIEENGENERTINRLCAFLLMLRNNPAEVSLERAWRMFPLAKLYP